MSVSKVEQLLMDILTELRLAPKFKQQKRDVEYLRHLEFEKICNRHTIKNLKDLKYVIERSPWLVDVPDRSGSYGAGGTGQLCIYCLKRIDVGVGKKRLCISCFLEHNQEIAEKMSCLS